MKIIIVALIALISYPALAERNEVKGNKNTDPVFVKTFQAAMAVSLCSDYLSIQNKSDLQTRGELGLSALCEKKRNEKNKAIVDTYLNAEKL